MGRKAGKGPLIQKELSHTLQTSQDQYLFVPLHDPCPPLDASYYKGCGERNGIEREVVAVGVDLFNQTTTGNVSKTMSSSATDSDHVPCVICIEGNGTRPSHKGSGVSEEPMFTLNTKEVHAVCYKADGSEGKDVAFAVVGDHENRVTDMTNLVVNERIDTVEL